MEHLQNPDGGHRAEAADLPPSLQALLKTGVPPESIQVFVQEFGGQRIYVPKSLELVDPEHPLLRILGKQGAEALVSSCGGFSFYVPKNMRAARRLRNAQIRLDYDRGVTSNGLVKKYGVGGRQLCTILKAAS
jgi:Mor family transcriptional regulator